MSPEPRQPNRDVLVPGTRLGDYEIKSMLGAGGMGEVYRARDTRLGRDVAIKVLPALLSADADRLRRFEQEARAAAALNHPNILAVFQMGTHNGSPYLVSELLEGETLREQLKHGKLTVRKAIEHGVQIARGLSVAHEKGVVHRDLKPENLFVTKDGRVKILDFGLAKLTQPRPGFENTAPTVGGETEPGAVMGTVGYMSPEQVRGQVADHRTDIFSFGAILYEMLAGKRAFQKPTPADTMSAILHEDPASISQLTTSIPPALQRVVHRCLEKSPEQRFQNASDLAFALDALSETPAHTSEAHVVQAPESRSRKRRVLLVAAIMVVVGAIVWGVPHFAPKPAPFQKIEITQLTTNGRVHTAAISPDGKYVAYAVDELGQSFYFGGKKKQSLWVRQVAGGGDVQIVPAAEVSYAALSFSKDGESLYAVMSEGRNAILSLYKMPVLGGTAKRLIVDLDVNAALSPDGRRVAFTRHSVQKSESALMLANEDGTAEEALAAVKLADLFWDVAWSPDGKSIGVVFGNSKSGDIEWDPVVISVQDKSRQALTNKRWSDFREFGWTADNGGLIAVASERNSGLRQLEYISYPAGANRRITTDLNDYAGVSLTDNSRTIATVQVKKSIDAWVAPIADISAARPITSGGRTGIVAWDSHGSILYDLRDARGGRKIWRMEPDGSNARQLTANSDVWNRAPRASPDGRYVAFVSESTSPHLWRMDADGNNPKQLTNSPHDLFQVGSPNFTPDGKWIVYGKWGPEWGIWKVSIDGGDPVRMNNTPSAAFPVVSPDGKMLAYTYLLESGRNGVAVMSLEGSAPETRFDIATEDLCWAPDSHSLLYVNTEGGVSNIWSQPLGGGAPKQLTHFNSDIIFSFDLSADGKQLVMSRGRTERDVVLIRDVK